MGGPPAAARRHWLMAVLLAAGLALRVITQVAYRPALIYIDSLKYLYNSGGADPVGYRALLAPALAVGNLDLVAALQHLLGLAMAIALYLLLLRRGVPRWLSALATAPVLLDAYQLQMEQTIMPDAAFEAVVVAGVVALAWQPRPRPALVVTAGVALGASATVWQVGEVLVLPALVYLAAVTPGWRRRLGQSAALVAAFALPILGYCAGSYLMNGHFRLSYTGASQLYGRMATAAGCRSLALPGYERPLCPSAAAVRLGVDGLDHNPRSPQWTYRPPPGMTRSGVVSGFNGQVLAQQPLRVAGAIAADAVKLFAVNRAAAGAATPISRWQFQPGYPFYPTALYSSAITPQVVAAAGRRFGGGGPVAVRPLAAFLRGYQLHGGFTPGPLLLLSALAGLAGTLAAAAGRISAASRADAARTCLLVSATGAAILLAADAFEFSWRYQLPALITLPPAGALGLIAVVRRRAPAAAAAGPVRGLGVSERGVSERGDRSGA